MRLGVIAVSLLVLLMAAADLRFHIIPKHLNYSCFAILLFTPSFELLFWSLGLFLVYLTIFKASSGALGYGDVRLAPVAAISAQNQSPLAIHVFAWALAGLYLLSKGEFRRSLPFAPFFAVSLITMTHL